MSAYHSPVSRKAQPIVFSWLMIIGVIVDQVSWGATVKANGISVPNLRVRMEASAITLIVIIHVIAQKVSRANPVNFQAMAVLQTHAVQDKHAGHIDKGLSVFLIVPTDVLQILAHIMGNASIGLPTMNVTALRTGMGEGAR